MNVYVSSPEGGIWMEVDWYGPIAEWKDRIRTELRIPYAFTLVHHNRLYLPHDTPIPDSIAIHEFAWNGRNVRVERDERKRENEFILEKTF